MRAVKGERHAWWWRRRREVVALERKDDDFVVVRACPASGTGKGGAAGGLHLLQGGAALRHSSRAVRRTRGRVFARGGFLKGCATLPEKKARLIQQRELESSSCRALEIRSGPLEQSRTSMLAGSTTDESKPSCAAVGIPCGCWVLLLPLGP